MMGVKVLLIWVGLFCLLTGGHAFRWTSSDILPDQTTVTTCPNSRVLLPWTFVLHTAKESLLNTEWRYQAQDAGSSEEVLATEVNGHFFADNSQGPQLQYMGTGASVLLPNASLSDSGVYSVRVNLRRADGLITTYSQRVHVLVTGNSAFGNGTLVARIEEVQFMNSSEEHHLILSCGAGNGMNGTAQISIIWTTPSGQTVSSTFHSKDGQYSLALPNPVQGGLYQCRVNASSPGASCIRGDSALMQGAAVRVDAAEGRMLVMEGEMKAVKNEVRNLRSTNGHLSSTVQALVSDNTHLVEQLQTLSSMVSRLGDTVADYQRSCKDDGSGGNTPNDHHSHRQLNGSCNFDADLCGYKQARDDQMDWTRQRGGTSTTGTGPEHDHTTGDDSGYYMYTETSGHVYNAKKAVLKSLTNEASREDICIFFWYHMFGRSMGTLDVLITNYTSDSPSLFSQSGDHGDKWFHATITVPAKYLTAPYQIVFQAIRAPSYYSDMAIDDVVVTKGACSSN